MQVVREYRGRMKPLAIIAALALLAGCATSTTITPAETTPEPTPTASSTFWDLAPFGDGDTLKALIDDSEAAGDCDELQAVFDTWADAEHVVDFTADLLEYVDGALERAGCYE